MEAACCPIDSLAGSSALPFVTLEVRQEHGMARYCLGHQGPFTEDRVNDYGHLPRPSEILSLILGSSFSDKELRSIYLIPGSKR